MHRRESDLLGAPRRVYNVSANHSFDLEALKGFEIDANYYFARRGQATWPSTYAFVLAPQQLLGVSASYHLNERLKLEIGAINLTNRANFTSNGALLHGEPRSFSANLSYKY